MRTRLLGSGINEVFSYESDWFAWPNNVVIINYTAIELGGGFNAEFHCTCCSFARDGTTAFPRKNPN